MSFSSHMLQINLRSIDELLIENQKIKQVSIVFFTRLFLPLGVASRDFALNHHPYDSIVTCSEAGINFRQNRLLG